MPAEPSDQKTKKEKVSKTFRIDRDVITAVSEIAVKENRTINNMVETVLKRYSNNYELG